MEPDQYFEPVEQDPTIPDKLLERTLQFLPTLVRVDVEHKVGKNSWKKINGFKINTRGISDEPDAEPEQVAGLAVMMAQTHQSEMGDEQHYRCKFHCKDKNKKITRRTYAFKLSDDSFDPEPALTNLEEQEVLAVAFDRAMGFIGMQNEHITALHAKVLELSSMHAGQTAPLLQIIETMMVKYQEGLTMSANAVQAMAEMDRGRAEAETTAKRNEMLMDLLISVAPTAMQQFGAYLGVNVPVVQEDAQQTAETAAQKAGAALGNPPTAAQAATGQRAGAPQPQGAPRPGPQASTRTKPKPKPKPTPTPAAQPDTSAQDEMTAEEAQNPLTVFAHAFRDTIQGEQWLKLTEVLTKKEIALFREATSAENDKATADGIMAFRDGLRPTKYLKLNRILDATQREMIMKLLEVIDDYQQMQEQEAGDEEEEEVEEEEEAEDEDEEEEEEEDTE